MSEFEDLKIKLKENPKRWLVTGCAGFIGSNLLESLLLLGQEVVGVDNYSTGYKLNLELVREAVGVDRYKNFEFIEGDICDLEICMKAVEGVDYLLHQAALGSVPRSVKNPVDSNANNVTGFLNILWAAKEKGVKRFVYASSSSVYGDDSHLPKKEGVVGFPLSPYAVTKKVNEIYSQVFSSSYGMEITGIRYFNVFGKRQDPNGAYAAVIPRWVKSMLSCEDIFIFGDGETSRDFCYIENVVQMNILAAASMAEGATAPGRVYNCAFGARTTLTELFEIIRAELAGKKISKIAGLEAVYKDFRAGDIRHSHADISLAQEKLGYQPIYNVRSGLAETLEWYCRMM